MNRSDRKIRANRAWMRRAGNALDTTEDSDPLGGVVNLFDASMVLVVALILALVGGASVAEVTARMSTKDVTIVTNPGQPDMEIIIKRGERIERLRSSDQLGTGRGQRLGVAYRLETGEVIYVPEAE